jgi:hypothetical protein
VLLPGGTTTVVFWGGGGLELEMQPASNPAATIALSNIFIVDSCAFVSQCRLWENGSLGGRGGSP